MAYRAALLCTSSCTCPVNVSTLVNLARHCCHCCHFLYTTRRGICSLHPLFRSLSTREACGQTETNYTTLTHCSSSTATIVMPACRQEAWRQRRGIVICRYANPSGWCAWITFPNELQSRVSIDTLAFLLRPWFTLMPQQYRYSITSAKANRHDLARPS
jgi:hypothetical protein